MTTLATKITLRSPEEAELFSIITLDGTIISSDGLTPSADVARVADLLKNARTDDHLATLLIRLLQST